MSQVDHGCRDNNGSCRCPAGKHGDGDELSAAGKDEERHKTDLKGIQPGFLGKYAAGETKGHIAETNGPGGGKSLRYFIFISGCDLTGQAVHMLRMVTYFVRSGFGGLTEAGGDRLGLITAHKGDLYCVPYFVRLYRLAQVFYRVGIRIVKL